MGKKKCTTNKTRLIGSQHRLHTTESTHSKGKQNSCLGVNRTDFTQESTANPICLKVTNTDHTHRRAPTARVSKIRVSGSVRSTSQKESTSQSQSKLGYQ